MVPNFGKNVEKAKILIVTVMQNDTVVLKNSLVLLK